ncbi:MAG: roadblock/LC7 domain-containing protein [bacterium]
MNLFDLTKIPHVLGAGVASYDGFIVDSQLVHGYDAEKFGAMSAKIVNQLKANFGKENASIILYTENLIFLAKPKPEGILFVIGDKEANLGLIKIKFKKL